MLQVDRLPDAADRGVPAAHQAALPGLFAAGLGEVGFVLDTQAQVKVYPMSRTI